MKIKFDSHKRILCGIMFAAGTILSWGGMTYAIYEPDNFKAAGVLVGLIGYGIFFGAACMHETIC